VNEVVDDDVRRKEHVKLARGPSRAKKDAEENELWRLRTEKLKDAM